MGINFSKILSSAGAKIILGDIKQLINQKYNTVIVMFQGNT